MATNPKWIRLHNRAKRMSRAYDRRWSWYVRGLGKRLKMAPKFNVNYIPRYSLR